MMSAHFHLVTTVNHLFNEINKLIVSAKNQLKTSC